MKIARFTLGESVTEVCRIPSSRYAIRMTHHVTGFPRQLGREAYSSVSVRCRMWCFLF